MRKASRVRHEALRLALVELSQSLGPVFLLATALVWAFLLADGSSARLFWADLRELHRGWHPELLSGQLLAWYVAALGCRVAQVGYSARVLRLGLNEERFERTATLATVFGTLESGIWAILLGIALEHAFSAPWILMLLIVLMVLGYARLALLVALPGLYPGLVLFPGVLIVTQVLACGEYFYPVLAAAVPIGCLLLYRRVRLGAYRLARQLQRQSALYETVSRLRQDRQSMDLSLRRDRRVYTARWQLLAAASHDLRQPIQAQALFLEALAGSALDSRQRQLLSNGQAAARAAGEMLDVLLDFSRIELGALRPNLQVFALQPLLAKLEADLAPQANIKGLLYRTRETDQVVFSDQLLLELILRNLITNSIRYTSRGGVLVACRRSRGGLRVEVIDTGVGIAAEHQQAIFCEFHKLESAADSDGLGLGLAIVARLSRVLGHSLSFTSREGRGSTFRVHLPIARLAAIPSARSSRGEPDAECP